MKVLVIVVLLFASSQAFPRRVPYEVYVPEVKSNNSRIIGGVEAAPGEEPWIVSLRRSNSHSCAGVIINTKTIVTAAHCIDG